MVSESISIYGNHTKHSQANIRVKVNILFSSTSSTRIIQNGVWLNEQGRLRPLNPRKEVRCDSSSNKTKYRAHSFP